MDVFSLFQNYGDTQQGAYDRFFRLFFDTELPHAVAEMTIFLKVSHIKHGQAAIRSIPPDSLDIAFGEAFNLIAKWSEDIDGELLIIHDQSSNMAKSKHIWDRAVGPNVPERVVGKDKRLCGTAAKSPKCSWVPLWFQLTESGLWSALPKNEKNHGCSDAFYKSKLTR
jgi:hypothetical protein